jgi:CDGSH-type Zn-finger protein
MAPAPQGTHRRRPLDRIALLTTLITGIIDRRQPMAEPQSPQKTPYGVDVEQGKTYYWCACGRSNNQPFCDGSHQGSEFTPVAYTAEQSAKVFFCGCKKTGNKPVCDGTHNSL